LFEISVEAGGHEMPQIAEKHSPFEKICFVALFLLQPIVLSVVVVLALFNQLGSPLPAQQVDAQGLNAQGLKDLHRNNLFKWLNFFFSKGLSFEPRLNLEW
jgi:hypothetical protein